MEQLRVKANGTELEVNQYPRNGETIVFLHFSGGNLAQWNGVIPYFVDKYHIVTLDLRGHGKSEKTVNGYTLDNMAIDIIEIMNQLGIEKAHIVGSSLGGEIAVNLAARFPERVKSIVAEGAIQNYFGENGVFNIRKEEIPNKKIELRAKRAKKNNPVFDSIVEKIEMAKKNYEQSGISWNKQIEEFEIYNTWETGGGKYTSACPKWVIDKYLEDFWDIKFEKYFEKITCPVLMLPSEDEWKSNEIKAAIESLQKLLKSSKVVVIPGGSHAYVAFQYPLELSKVIQAFHKEVEQN
ncbi:alpha/beta hydrolase fold [Proteiniborus sp. DW1]|uniref:alpha/beta fold hydrolase n=1 Tax=Proteiniborus sp. DW1 TaxID=1889883 RepID=UPI00092E0968|nr:alpha/beta hydrolase [Proteiniborus sp. DW1]SCG84446.1 alpha/beta hydrolase fold [Proteiniborus sp. DW1]